MLIIGHGVIHAPAAAVRWERTSLQRRIAAFRCTVGCDVKRWVFEASLLRPRCSVGSLHRPQRRAPRDSAESVSELLIVTWLELADAQGTVGKLSTRALPWRHQRAPPEPSEPSTIEMDHS